MRTINFIAETSLLHRKLNLKDRTTKTKKLVRNTHSCVNDDKDSSMRRRNFNRGDYIAMTKQK